MHYDEENRVLLLTADDSFLLDGEPSALPDTCAGRLHLKAAAAVTYYAEELMQLYTSPVLDPEVHEKEIAEARKMSEAFGQLSNEFADVTTHVLSLPPRVYI